MKEVLGGKGAGLAEMTRIGLPVPAGFTISAAVLRLLSEARPHLSRKNFAGRSRQISRGLEKITGKKLGDSQDPLLVSVRSGSARSMPGMMETILNLGLNDRSVEGLAERTGKAAVRLGCVPPFCADVFNGGDWSPEGRLGSKACEI